MSIFGGFWKRQLGDKGEDLAVKFLKKNGYRILRRNFSTHVGEIDIIATKEGELVLVEVKTRTSSVSGYPEDAVDKKKKKKIASVGETFRYKNKIENYPWRIDIIAVEQSDNGLEVTRHLVGV